MSNGSVIFTRSIAQMTYWIVHGIFCLGNVTYAGWQLTLCNPMNSRSDQACWKLLYSIYLAITVC